MRKASKGNPLPLYYQIKEIIQEMIENEQLAPGEAIPPEREICDIQGVSRMTVNKAILELVNEGILYRVQGKGTYVSEPKEYQKLSRLKGFTEEMQSKGYNTETKILSFQIKKSTKRIKAILKIQENDDEVIKIKRLRFVKDEPIAIETVWIAKHLFPNMTEEMIDGKSLYHIFKNQYNYNFEKAEQTVEPKILNAYEIEMLESPLNNLALLFKKIIYINDNQPLEYTEAVYRGDKYKYEVFNN